MKSIYFTTGLAEAGETFHRVCDLLPVAPMVFAVAWVFTVICLYTAFSRIMQARAEFPDDSSEA